MEKIYKCAGVIIYRINPVSEKYEICLVQSNKFRQQQTGALLYIIPGGKLEEKDYAEIEESDPQREEKAIIACARREVKEETDLDLENIVLFATKTKTAREMGYSKDLEVSFVLYDLYAKGGGKINIGKELVHADWYPFEELPECMEPYLRDLIMEVYKTHINIREK